MKKVEIEYTFENRPKKKIILAETKQMAKKNFLRNMKDYMDKVEIKSIKVISELYYGVYNNMKKEFQFNIKEKSPSKARYKLAKIIGNDCYKWRFEYRVIEEVSYERNGV
jgi:hypothetical protein